MFIPLKDTNVALRKPRVTYLLILGNIIMFLISSRVDMSDWVFSEDRLLAGEALGFSGLITYQFLHGSWSHLFFNMLFLYIFGDNMESSFGRYQFLLFYLGCGVGAALFEVFADPYFGAEAPGLLIGASGSVSGILGAYLLRYPKAKILTWTLFVLLLKIPAGIFIGIWIATQFLYQFLTPTDSTAYIAHIGGFVIGLVYYSVYHRIQIGRYHEH